jgi:Domain of unknown function (DUF5134)
MGGPSWITGTFAAVMIVIAVYTAGRLVASGRRRRPTELDADGVHVVMGVAMAGMLATGLRFLPAGVWEAVFGAGAVWFGWQVVRERRGASQSPWRCPHPVPHLVECGAMVYMLLIFRVSGPAAGGSAMGGMALPATASRFSVLALGMAVFMFGYVVWLGDRLTLPARALASAAGSGPAASGAAAVGVDAGAGTSRACRPSLAPRCAACYKIAMGITMGYMLVLML